MIEYGDAILNTACKTVLKKLEVLHTTAVRKALGLPKWVPKRFSFASPQAHKHTVPPIQAFRIGSLAFEFWIKHYDFSN